MHKTFGLTFSKRGAPQVVDFDTVDVTNKNRQLLALDSTLGRNKAVLMAERIKVCAEP
jgi:tRNA A37 threonylcarbamoyladenosine dehydratase